MIRDDYDMRQYRIVENCINDNRQQIHSTTITVHSNCERFNVPLDVLHT